MKERFCQDARNSVKIQHLLPVPVLHKPNRLPVCVRMQNQGRQEEREIFEWISDNYFPTAFLGFSLHALYAIA